MKIEYRNGSDWAELLLDGEVEASGHRITQHEFMTLLLKLGHEVHSPRGEFCNGGCGTWMPGADEGLECASCGEL